MKSFSLFAAVLVVTAGSFARADVIVCHQTEPFITETYNTDQGTVVIEDANFPKPTKEKGLKLIIRAPGKFDILNANGTLRRTLLLNDQGSDGMSDRNYPFDGGQGHNGPVGCESLSLKAKGDA